MSYDTSNPILNAKNFEYSNSQMATTLNGVVNRCLILLAIVMFSAAFAWSGTNVPIESLMAKLALFSVAGLVTVVITSFQVRWASYTAPLYAIFEGLVLGSISKIFESYYNGIVIQAVALTFGTAFSMLLLYKYDVIKVTDKFRAIVTTATLGIAAVYMVSWIMSFFGSGIGFIHSGGVFGLLFSVFVVVVAALSLLLDFDFITKVSNRGLPSYVAWYAAMGLMVTLVWLYLEMLRMLAKFKDSK